MLQRSTFQKLAIIPSLALFGCGAEGDASRPSALPGGGEVEMETEDNGSDEVESYDGLCSPNGDELILLINDYRVAADLPPIPTSPSLCRVAEAHIADLIENKPYEDGEGCALQSWSDASAEGACCYTAETAQCSWDKPAELTEYPGLGYETVAINPPTPEAAVEHLTDQPAQAELILEQGQWEAIDWRAIGASFEDGHVSIWFGEETDPTLE